MLVLTRKSNQSIMIGDDVEVSVLSVMGEKVRIGIQAPQEIPVFRKEIYLEIHRESRPGGGGERRQFQRCRRGDRMPRAQAPWTSRCASSARAVSPRAGRACGT